MGTSAVRILVSVGFLVTVSQAALAMTPEQATELLARAQAADQKCNILTVSDKDELSTIVAQAEIALAESTNVETTKSALAKGRTAGANVACDSTTKKAVVGVYESARGALGATSIRKSADTDSANRFDRDEDDQDQDLAEQNDEPQDKIVTASTAKPKPKVPVTTFKKPIVKSSEALVAPEKVAAKVKSPLIAKQAKTATEKLDAKKSVKTTAKPSNDKKFVALSAYGAMAEKYYTELRCRKMPMAAIKKFHGQVLTTHKQAVATHGKPAVKNLLNTAESRANKANCG